LSDAWQIPRTTRIFYGLLGIGIMLVGVLLAAGVIQDAR
jgi:hypothetical protein